MQVEAEKSEAVLIIASEKISDRSEFPNGAKCLNLLNGSLDISGLLQGIKKITPLEAMQLLEQRRQDGYREVDRQLTAIKKTAMLL
jgi:hypothetical protein